MINKLKRNIIKFLQWKSRHRVFSWPAYGKWVETVHQDKSKFVPFTTEPYIRKEGDVKIFAYYLSQFHAIPENDDAHGKGFTEWNNVASCSAHYVGQYQPKIPYDLGFYNLLMPGVMERQVEIAKAYGVYGFCFYYYWFSGKRVLEKPLEYWLEHKEIDFHYHFCWANENWSKLWDGGNNEVFLKQEYKEDDAEKFFYDILPYIQDERYEKIGNRPMLMIYRPNLFEKSYFLIFLHTLNKLAHEYGFGDFYITGSNFNFDEPHEYGCDGVTEFPPHKMYRYCKEERSISRLIPETNFKIYNTHEYIKNQKYLYETDYQQFKCCFPSWDNSPRKAFSNGFSFILSDHDFESWLSGILKWTREHNDSDKQYVYLNAWNEWAEGATLEPTLRYGYKYLQIVKRCIEQNRK